MTATTKVTDVLPGRAYLAALAQRYRGAVSRLVVLQLMSQLSWYALLGLFAYVIKCGIIDGQAWHQQQFSISLVILALILRLLLGWWLEGHKAKVHKSVQQYLTEQLTEHWRVPRSAPLTQQQHQWSAVANAELLITPINQIATYVSTYLPSRYLMLLLPLTILLVVGWLDWLVALLLFFTAPLIPIFMALIGMGAEAIQQRHLLVSQRLGGLFVDRIRHLTSLKSFRAISATEGELSEAAEHYRASTMATLRVAFLSSAVLEFFAAIAVAAVAIYVGFGLLGYYASGPASDLTLFTGLFALMLAPEYFQPLRDFAQRYHDNASALAAAADLERQFNEQPIKQPIPQAQLRFKAVDFSYRSDLNPVLQCFSWSAPRCGMVAITGASGSGKSTLLKLAAGLVAPSSGTVTAPASLYLDQQPWLVAGSIARNLRLAAPAVSESAMISALQAVNLWQRFESNGGLAYRLGEHGNGLSGGEAQRVALARVILSPCPLLLLDEPTVMIDDVSAAIIRRVLVEISRADCLVVIATHDPQLIEQSDETLTVEDAG